MDMDNEKISPGSIVRSKREHLLVEKGKQFSLRQVAERVGVEPSYLSKIERNLELSPSEVLLIKLAKDLELNEIVLLAQFGKVHSDVKRVILEKPEAFTQLIKALEAAPSGAVFNLVRQVSDGDW